MSFSRYNTEDSVISSETVVRGMWSGDINTLSSFFTASDYTEYYIDVYNGIPSNTGSSVQFSIQYGNILGGGSAPINPQVPGVSPSRIIYGQYRNLIFGDESGSFKIDGTNISDNIYVINIARSRYKESLFPGSFNLLLSGSGTNKISLTDDSGTTTLTRFLGENRYYNIISGSGGSPATPAAATTYYGILLPDIDLIILDPDLLTGSITPPSSGSTARTDAAVNLYNSLVRGGNFQLQSAETISARYFFTRIKNSEYNYTTNPSIIDDNGNLLYNTLINNPQTYITTVGMYNDNNELLAVAKLSKPLTKDFTKEALIRIKLDY
jgi:hypothetical protein